MRVVGRSGQDEGWAGVPGQLFASRCLSGVSVGRGRGDVLFEPRQAGFEILDLPLDVFELLRSSSVSAM